MYLVVISYCIIVTAAAAAAVCDTWTSMSRESFLCTQDHVTWPTQGQRVAGQLNWRSKVAVLLLSGILAASAPECVGLHYICYRLGPPKNLWCCGIRQQSEGAMTVTKLSQQNLIMPYERAEMALNVALWVNTAKVWACCIGTSWIRQLIMCLELRKLVRWCFTVLSAQIGNIMPQK